MSSPSNLLDALADVGEVELHQLMQDSALMQQPTALRGLASTSKDTGLKAATLVKGPAGGSPLGPEGWPRQGKEAAEEHRQGLTDSWLKRNISFKKNAWQPKIKGLVQR